MKKNILYLLFIITLTKSYAGMAYKGISRLEINSQAKYAYFPILTENWVNYDIGIFDTENNTFLRGIKILDDYPDYHLKGISLLSDTVILANINNSGWDVNKKYNSKLLFLDIESGVILQTLEYENDIISVINTYDNDVFILFESGRFLEISGATLTVICDTIFKTNNFPIMKVNNGVFAITSSNNSVSLFNTSSGELITTIQTEALIEDLVLNEDSVIILQLNTVEKYSIQGELLFTKDFSEHGFHTCRQLVSKDKIFLRFLERGIHVYYLYSLSSEHLIKIPLSSNSEISKIIQLNENRFLLGLSDVVGIFMLPNHQPEELISIVTISNK